jgi:cytochrome c peroxidase
LKNFFKIHFDFTATGLYPMALICVLFWLVACKSEDDTKPMNNWVYNPTPVKAPEPPGFPDEMEIPQDNPLTLEGIALGEKLFSDPILSGDNTQSCAHCHKPEFSFSDSGEALSIGIDGKPGTRNTMALINPGYQLELNWDGSATTLEEQAFEPVVNPLEMHATWSMVTQKLRNHTDYPQLFYEAFGIEEIDSNAVVKALAQYERTIINNQSRWDLYLEGAIELNEQEAKGFEIFFTEKGDCFHCHSTILFTDNIYHNNGLDAIASDSGLYGVTGNPFDIGKFRTPTLRNLAKTAPYMHDGRFETLEEVINFYSEGLKFSETIDPLMKNVAQGGVQLSVEDKLNLLAFLDMLNDEQPAFPVNQ